jgi:hypothetical protein
MNKQLTEENVMNDSHWGPYYRGCTPDEERYHVYKRAQQEYDNLGRGISRIPVHVIGSGELSNLIRSTL